MINWPADTLTLAIDIGGSGIKASVINKDGEMVCERIRMETPYPSHPSGFSQVVSDFVKVLPKAESRFQDELELHKLFEEYKLQGEWFQLNN